MSATTIWTSYAVDSGGTEDNVIFLNGHSPYTVTLPRPTVGRAIKFKDKSGVAATRNVTIAPHGSECIDGISTYVIKTNRGGVELTSDGVNWWVTGQYNGTVN